MRQPLTQAALMVALLLSASLSSTVDASPLTLAPEPFAENAITASYDPATGNLSVKSDLGVTSFEVTSSSALFIPERVNPGVLKSPFDVMTTSKWFILDVDGFTDLDVGPIYPAGMETNAILADLNVAGSLDGGGSLDRELGTSPHLYIVPEPAGLTLLGLAGLALVARIRRRTWR